jgi:putative toxin-antitoxin system antitoxin component (TIGR02293 family)
MKTIVEKSFKTTSNTDMLSLIETVRKGINFKSFLSVPGNNNFNLHEWSNILHLSERTMQRYKKESIPFEPLQSEKILQIALIFQKGKEVFGDEKKFSQWLSAENLSLGGSKPKELLDNVFGIQMIENELIKIEYGILA